MSFITFSIHILFALILFFISFSITWFMCHKIAILDHPNERSSHSSATPRGGGLAIVITFFIGMSAIYWFGDATHIKQNYMLGFIVSSILIALISFYDDIQEKSAQFKLLSHLIAVAVVLYSGIVLDQLALPIVGYINLSWAGYLISLLWIIGLTNAYNFMDGLDGLVGGVTAIASLFFMAICYYGGSHFVYISSYTLLAGSLGFLVLNTSPAKIFMGDIGSTFIGFTFASLAIIAARYDNSHISFFVVPLLLFNIIYDVIFTLIRRWMRGEKLTEAHRSHLYQLMNQIGYSHLEVSLTHYCMAFLQGLGALWMVQISGTNRIYVFVPFFLMQFIYTYWIMRKAGGKNLL